MSVEIITFGCRLNAHESDIIRTKATESGLNNVFIINSCAVTSEAERQLRQEIRKLKKLYPDKKIILTGCAAQINGKEYEEMVDAVIGNIDKLKDETYFNIQHQDKLSLVSDIMQATTTRNVIVEKYEAKVRGYLQVQTGCNHRCTFCIIPYGRGNSRSVPFREILQQAESLIANGCKEIVITGVDITDYGLDLPGQPSLGQLVKRLLKYLPNLPRLRLSSVDVAEIEKDLIDVIANDMRFMPHLHLSLQSGDNMILKRMKRRHSREQVIKFCHQIISLRSDIVFGADIIAGFPTESNDMFENTYNLLLEIEKIIHLHIFPYSIRNGTPAAKMPQVEIKTRKERAKKLRDLGELLLINHLKQQVGKKIKVLIESDMIGRSEDFCIVNVANKEIGLIIEGIVKSIHNDKLFIE